MIDTGDLVGLTDAELIARMEEAAAREDGWYEAEQLGRRIAQSGSPGLRLIESLVDHDDDETAVAAVGALRGIRGWSEDHPETLRRLIFGVRPEATRAALYACWGGSAEGAEHDRCFLPDIADQVAFELTGHPDSGVRSGAVAYLSVCAPDRHFDAMVGGLSDPAASVRLTTVTRLSWGVAQVDVRRRAVPLVWQRLDDDDLFVRDWAQLLIESEVWSSEEPAASSMLPADPKLVDYSRTRWELGPHIGPNDEQPDIERITRTLNIGEARSMRRGAADELEEWLESAADLPVIEAMLELGRRHADDDDPRVRQAMEALVERASSRW